MLLTKDIEALVIHIDLKGKQLLAENEDYVWVSKPIENWHECTLDYRPNFGGLENMSLSQVWELLLYKISGHMEPK
jgi:UDP-N-acetylmuramate dehydrogenase